MKKIAGRLFRLVCGVVPILFASVFLASTVSLYLTASADRLNESKLESIFRALPRNSRSAGNIEAIFRAEVSKASNPKTKKVWGPVSAPVHLSTHGCPRPEKLSVSKNCTSFVSARLPNFSADDYALLEKRDHQSLGFLSKSAAAQRIRLPSSDFEAASRDNDRAVSIVGAFDSLLSSMAELLTTIKVTEAEVRFEQAHHKFGVSLNQEDAYERYVFSRLALEKSRQKQQIKPLYYYEFRKALATEYLRVAATGESRQAPTLTANLHDAEFEINQLRDQVSSLKTQLAQAQKSKAERWIPIVVAVLSLLIALSTHLITWRSERRQTREAELFILRRQELEQTILQRSIQIQEAHCRVIRPTEREIELYSTHTSSSITSST